MTVTDSQYRQKVCTARTAEEIFVETIAVKTRILNDRVLLEAARAIGDRLIAGYRAGARVFMCGNGGSAADAQHFAAELTGHLIFDRPPLGAEALHANSSHLTAVANDYDYDTVFARALEGSARPGDTLFAISTSGNSMSVLRAAKTARELGVTVVAMTGESRNLTSFLFMRSPNMSNTRFSRLANRKADPYAAIRKMVAERAGHQWCLFLDRDGVINRQVVGDYVRNWRQFEWLPGAARALKKLRAWAPYIVVVTNQQGVGAGLMSAVDVMVIHRHLQMQLASDGVLIDGFQVCPHHRSQRCGCRKPRPGLVLDWLGRHPDSEPLLSIVVGDSLSDLELAHNVAAAAGACASVQIGGASSGGVADASFDSLWEFAVAVGHARGERG